MIKILSIITGAALVVSAALSCQVKAVHSRPDEADELSFVRPVNNSDETMTLKEFTGWCADKENKLAKEKTISGIRFKLSYLPAEIMALLELRSEHYDFEKFLKTRDTYLEMVYFNFKIEATDGTGELLKYKLESPAQYEARVKYLSFDMQNDLCLVQGNDTLLPGLYQFERTFGVAPYATVMLAFDAKKLDKSKGFTLVYNDRLFETGLIKFSYSDKQLINLPNINGL